MLAIIVAFGCGATSATSPPVHETAGLTSPVGSKAAPVASESFGSRPLTLEECIRLTLEKSPYMDMAQVEINIKKIDAKNQWWRMFPKLKLYVTNNVNLTTKDDKSRNKLSVSFLSGTWDPVGSYLSHDASLLVTKLAKYEKLKTANELIANVIKIYIHAEFFDLIMHEQRELEELGQETLSYLQKMYPDAPVVPLEIRQAEQELKKVSSNRQTFVEQRVYTEMRAKRMMGIPVEQKIVLAKSDFADRVDTAYAPQKISYQELRSSALFAKMNAVRKELSNYGVYAAWADYVPKFTVAVRTPDPISSTTSGKEDFYLTLGINVPLLYWGELGRNIDRAKLAQKSEGYRRQISELTKEDNWYKGLTEVRAMQRDLDLSKVDLELQELALRKSEILFDAGQATYKDLVSAKVAVELKKIKLLSKQQNYLIRKLDAYALTGRLLNHYIEIKDDDL
ncbi:TolC family protein [Pseudodesulfovibrio methanolicus]|uniref:TolC family protein n=1 Tax=Pseudodesulfovibrio methanolicus TaxID=3126690 RepID=A0ABZ2ITV4_9BACT